MDPGQRPALRRPAEHVAAFTYASDLTLLGAALVPHGINLGPPSLQPASLDHSIWFHRPFRADEWWLYDQWSPTASGGRGLALARVFAQDGPLVATVAQEGLIRVRPTLAERFRDRLYHYIDVVSRQTRRGVVTVVSSCDGSAHGDC